jgi:hypothetical protein
VALAAIESRYWKTFCHQAGLNFTLDERFDDSGRVLHQLELFFSRMNLITIKNLINFSECCLSLVE